MLGVAAPNLLPFAQLLEPLRRVFADRLEQRKPRLPVPRLLALLKQVLADQRLEPVERRVADRLGRLQRAAAGEHGQARQQPARVLVEQLVAPVDRATECPLVRGEIARSAGQERQPLSQPLQHRLRRQDADARRSQLDRERQTVEAHTNLRDRGRVVGGQLEVGASGPRTVEKESHRLVCERLASSGSRSGSGSDSGGTGYSCSAVSRSAARLVTRSFKPGAATRRSPSEGAASIRCSRLSSTSSVCLSCRNSRSASASGRAPDSVTPRVCATVGKTAQGPLPRRARPRKRRRRTPRSAPRRPGARAASCQTPRPRSA